MEHKVVEINFKDYIIVSIVCGVNGKQKEIKGDIFISSIPLKNLVNELNRKVPSKIKKIDFKLPYRDFNIFVMKTMSFGI